MNGILEHLQKLIESRKPEVIAEIGCGTGYWINKLYKDNLRVVGIDLSVNMLKKAKRKNDYLNLINANACQTPLKQNKFDIIFLVNAIHLFDDIRRFLSEVFYVLDKGGIITIVLADIRHSEYHWYIYDYFEHTKEFDMNRIPVVSELEKELLKTGFQNITVNTVDINKSEYTGIEVLDDPFLMKNNTSTLAALSKEEYERGLTAIKSEIKLNKNHKFKSYILFRSITAEKII